MASACTADGRHAGKDINDEWRQWVALRQTHDMESDVVGRLPDLCRGRAIHFFVANEIHEDQPRRHAATPEEMEVRDPVGELIEVSAPGRTALPDTKSSPHEIERTLDTFS